MSNVVIAVVGGGRAFQQWAHDYVREHPDAVVKMMLGVVIHGDTKYVFIHFPEQAKGWLLHGIIKLHDADPQTLAAVDDRVQTTRGR